MATNSQYENEWGHTDETDKTVTMHAGYLDRLSGMYQPDELPLVVRQMQMMNDATFRDGVRALTVR